MHWTDRLNNDVYGRLSHCCSRKSDIPELVDAKWADYRTKGKDKQGFTREDAVIDILELLDSNSQNIDLTRDEYDDLCNGTF
jgi:hypothetical protein